MSDKTNYGQSLTHMIKGNLGAGILSMPRSFANLGLVTGLLVLPLLCIISGYCVHILVRSSRHLSKRINKQDGEQDLNYSILARRSFEIGPSWLNDSSHTIGRLVDTALLVTQIGVCCVYIVFVVDNVTSIMASYHIHVTQSITFMAIFPVALMLSFIRTLSRLAIASLLANLIQAIGLIFIVEYLLRDMKHDTLRHDNFRPLNEMALGFGSVMFAFEGISVVLPIYNRISRREQFGSLCGVINISFLVILMLYMIVGLLGYLRYGPHVKDSITLNLPAEPLYDAVRAMFTASILLTYPLQFYVPNEIIWEWAKRNVLSPPTLDEIDPPLDHEVACVVPPPPPPPPSPPLPNVKNQNKFTPPSSLVMVGKQADENNKNSNTSASGGKNSNLMNQVIIISEKYTQKLDITHTEMQMPPTTTTPTTLYGSRVDLINNLEGASPCGGGGGGGSLEDCSITNPKQEEEEAIPVRYEYLCRILVVGLTFALAYSVPKLNLLMDLIGSFSGVLLCLVIPCLIHMASYWEKLRGIKKCLMIIVDGSIVTLGLTAGIGGSLSSLNQIIKGVGGGH